MSASPTPSQWLLLIVAAAIAVSGWIYGVQWKRVATGGDTTHEEKVIIDLQDQLDRLRGENERLSGLLNAPEKQDLAPAPASALESALESESSEPPGTPPPVAQ